MELTTDEQKAKSFNFFFAKIFNQKTEITKTCSKQNLNFPKVIPQKSKTFSKMSISTSLLDQTELENYC